MGGPTCDGVRAQAPLIFVLQLASSKDQVFTIISPAQFNLDILTLNILELLVVSVLSASHFHFILCPPLGESTRHEQNRTQPSEDRNTADQVATGLLTNRATLEFMTGVAPWRPGESTAWLQPFESDALKSKCGGLHALNTGRSVHQPSVRLRPSAFNSGSSSCRGPLEIFSAVSTSSSRKAGTS